MRRISYALLTGAVLILLMASQIGFNKTWNASVPAETQGQTRSYGGSALPESPSGAVSRNETPDARSTHTIKQQQPQTLQGTPLSQILPDLEHVPIYPDPDAKLIEALDRSVTWRRLIYETTADIEVVQAFYEDALLRQGWLPPDVDVTESTTSNYFWSDPSKSLPWHLKLDVALNPKDAGGTTVILIYGRYPDAEDNLPIYQGAHNIEMQKTVIPGPSAYPTTIITKTYVTDATLQDIENYYNSTLPSHGWVFFDSYERSGRDAQGVVGTQTGSISAGEGLYFRGNRDGSSDRTAISMHLQITASMDQLGTTRVRLRVEVIETKIGL